MLRLLTTTSKKVNSITYLTLRNFSKLFTKEHEWISIEKDIATVGITDYAQNELGDIVHVELPRSGDKFKHGDSLGTIESVKTVATIYSPVEGVIVETNDNLLKNPSLLNNSPTSQGWYAKLRIDATANKKNLNSLMNEEQYNKFLSETNH